MIDKLNKILRFPERIPCDKRIHFLVGSIIASILVLFMQPAHVLAVGIILGIGLEYYLKYTKSGNFEITDMIATISGFLVVLIPVAVKGVFNG